MYSKYWEEHQTYGDVGCRKEQRCQECNDFHRGTVTSTGRGQPFGGLYYADVEQSVLLRNQVEQLKPIR